MFLPFNNAEEKVFKNQVIWVTGASAGIGAMLAKDFAVSGANIIISARRQEQLDEVAKECKSLGAKEVTVLPLDVLNYDNQQVVYNQIIQKYGKIDIAVLNPGRTQRGMALDTSLEDTQKLMELNFISFVSLTKIITPNMIKQGSGSLVVISSISGKMGTPLSSTYSASKWAIHGYYDGLRAEYSSKGLHVLLVCPGPVVSEITKHGISGEGKSINTDEGVKMPTSRCTELTLKAIKYKFDEVWISTQPFLFITYLSQYTPEIARFLFKFVFGPARVNAYETGGNVFDVKEALSFIWK